MARSTAHGNSLCVRLIVCVLVLLALATEAFKIGQLRSTYNSRVTAPSSTCDQQQQQQQQCITGTASTSSSALSATSSSTSASTTEATNDSASIPDEYSPKAITNKIMTYFKENGRSQSSSPQSISFQQYLSRKEVLKALDGVHVSILMFQCARNRRMSSSLIPSGILLKKAELWSKKWNERDISTFVYGIRALDSSGQDKNDALLIKLAATKINETDAKLSSRAIGNALYGLQDITSDTEGAAELCAALATKISEFRGDLNGQDIGIGLYGLQGMSASLPEVRQLVSAMASKIKASDCELDGQAISNALYGMQSFTDEFPEVLELVSALATKVSESRPEMIAQAIGSALYGLQKLSSKTPEVRRLVAALAEKVEVSTTGLDAQAIGNALFGLQNMKSDNVEVRALAQAIATKLVMLEVVMDSKSIGSALYGLHSMSSDEPQVRALLAALADRISISTVSLGGQGIADALYGLYGMTSDCPELRTLLAALAERIDETRGKLDSQEIGNSLYGLQGMSSEMYEVRVIAGKLAEKIKRSKAVLRSQHIGRSLLGLQRLSASYPEVRYLLKQITARIADSDRTRFTAASLSDALYGLQGMTSNIPEVQELLQELAKKVSSSQVDMTAEQWGRALFGLQGLSTSASLFMASAVGVDDDETSFLLSTLWDKMRVQKSLRTMPLSSLSQGLLGVLSLRDPIGNNIREFLYEKVSGYGGKAGEEALRTDMRNEDVITTVRALLLNDLEVPDYLATAYLSIEELSLNGLGSVLKSFDITEGEAIKAAAPLFPVSRADKLVVQRYDFLNPNQSEQNKLVSNVLVDGFRLDMFFPNAKLNIELDGPSHRFPARARFDAARDDYLRLKKGFQIHRIQLFGKSIDEIIAQIEAIRADKTEKMEDVAIQELYKKNTAADSLIQSIYSKNVDPEPMTASERMRDQPSETSAATAAAMAAQSNNTPRPFYPRPNQKQKKSAVATAGAVDADGEKVERRKYQIPGRALAEFRKESKQTDQTLK